jgi:hypothetical protein
LGCPLENSWIVRSRESYVLDTYDVDVRLPTNQPADDVVVEVLVCGYSQHGWYG